MADDRSLTGATVSGRRFPATGSPLLRFVGWLTLTHTPRRHAHRRSTGWGICARSDFSRFRAVRWPSYDGLCNEMLCVRF